MLIFGKVDDIYELIYYAIEVMLNMMFNIIISRKRYFILNKLLKHIINY